MSQRLIAITSVPGPTYKIHLGGDSGPNSLTPSYQQVEELVRASINWFDYNRSAALGVDRVVFSHDNGANWQSTGISGYTGPRQLQWASLTHLFATFEDGILLSADSGASFSSIGTLPAPFDSDSIIFDSFWADAVTGWVIVGNPETTESWLFYTPNSGGTWYSFELSSVVGWGNDQSPRRIKVWTGPGEVRILSSHKLWSLTHNADLTSVVMTELWDHDSDSVAQFPWMPPTGNDLAGGDANTRFDDLEWTPPSRYWMGGQHGLRAHSLNGTLFQLTDIDAVGADSDHWYTHTALDPQNILAGSSSPGSSLYPYRPGLNLSGNGGLDSFTWKLFNNDPDERLLHHDGLMFVERSGCSHPDGCDYIPPQSNEYEGPVTTDSGCSHVVQLINCISGEVLHASTPAIADLRCRRPSVTLSIADVDQSGIQSVTLAFAPGISLTGYFFIYPILSTGDRIASLQGQMIAWINGSGTGFRAQAEGANSIVIESPSIQYAAGSLAITHSGWAPIQSSLPIDGGTTGAVISITERPGACWRVCGYGPCDKAEAYGLETVHSSCGACVGQTFVGICMDCSVQVSVGGVFIPAASSLDGAQCISAGQSIDLFILAGFPQEENCNIAQVVATIEHLQDGEWVQVFTETFPAVLFTSQGNAFWNVDEYGSYRVTIAATGCPAVKTCTYYLTACAAHSIQKTGCHEHRITLNRPSGSIPAGAENRIVITDMLTGTVLQDEVVPDELFPVSFVNDRDMVYLIEVTGPGNVTWSSELIDLCDIEECRKSLIEQMMCEEDPCKKDLTRDQKLAREELSRISVLMQEIDALIYSYRYRWMNEPEYLPTRKTDLERIARALELAERLTERCAKCRKTTQPCRDC